MKIQKIYIAHCIVVLSIVLFSCNQVKDRPAGLSSKDTKEETIWLQPTHPSDPLIWGHNDGIRIGLHPMPGPRGLVRIYAPYLGHEQDKMINFIAFEPIVKGQEYRGFSELERSSIDGERGKLFFCSNNSDKLDFDKNHFATGIIGSINGVEALTLFVHSEPFENGANVYVRVRFYKNKPYEIELTSYTHNDSAPLEYMILTATMGNFARLRELYLKDTTIASYNIWPKYKDIHFTDHFEVNSEDMIHSDEGDLYFIAATNEKHPEKVAYDKSTKEHWKYYGKRATQYWSVENSSKPFKGLVNGRYTYWASESLIPGGISYENFELKRQYYEGQKLVFGVSPETPQRFIETITK